MTVKDLIKKLVECDMNATIMINKELEFNLWLNATIDNVTNEDDVVLLDFHFPEQLKIERK